MAAVEMGEVDEIHSNEENIKDGASVNGDVSDYKDDDDDDVVINEEVPESELNINNEDQDEILTDHEKTDEEDDGVQIEDLEDAVSIDENELEENELEENEDDDDDDDIEEIIHDDVEEIIHDDVQEIIHDEDSNEQVHEIVEEIHDIIDNSDVEEEEKSEKGELVGLTNGLNSFDEGVVESNSNDKNCEIINDSGEDVVMLDDIKDPIEVLDDNKDPIEVLDDNKDPIENGSMSESGDDCEISDSTSTHLTIDDGDIISVEDSPSKKKKKDIDSGPPRRSSRNLNRERKSYIEAEEEEYLKEKEKKLQQQLQQQQQQQQQQDQEQSSEESDIEEVMPQDPLAVADIPVAPALQIEKTIVKKSRISSSTIVVKDTKCLAEIASKSTANNNNNSKKEPTLVIIDTNSILSGRGPVPIAQKSAISSPISNSYSMLPMALPAQGIYPANMRATITPIPMTPPAPPPKPTPPPLPPAPVLPTLTDDMFVVEAPSFIVPYVYEKPPIKDLKDFVKNLESEIADQKKKTEEKQELEKLEREKCIKEKLDKEKLENEKLEKEKEEEKEKLKEKLKAEEEKEKNEDNENSEGDTETNEKKEDEAKKQDDEKMDVDKESEDTVTAGEKEEKPSADNEILNKEDIKQDKVVDTDLPSMPLPTATTLAAELRKPPATYFDSPLGKFFMGIGYSLVQEAVQSDLLKQQKRRREREGGQNPETLRTISSLTKNLDFTKENNEPYRMETKKCEFCSFKTESSLAMAYHLETPHMKNYVYRCNFCSYEVRSPHDILFHMEVQHGVRGRLERAPAFHQCPNCPFEDNQKGKLSRHLVACTRKFKPDRNLEPPADYEPPAKIPRAPRMKQQGLGTAAAVYQAMARNSQYQMMSKMSSNLPALQRGRGRPTLGTAVKTSPGARQTATNMLFKQGNMSGGSVLVPTNYQLSGNQLYQVVGGQDMGGRLGPGGATAFLPNISATPNSLTIQQQQQQQSPLSKMKPVQQPSISITPLPRGSTTTGVTITKPGDSNPKNSFVICEICDGYIKDLEQLRNHMQWIHKVKIHPKMIYNRPPLNCQKCQFRFFTDQGLERHLLGSHGLVTSSMQEAANKSKDAGRCPVCGRVYQWKLLNHVARDHNMTLKPAHLSYKCTVCTATFGMYKQFESHVYSAHSVVAKRVMDKKTTAAAASTSSASKNESVLKPLKINDEITIIPQPAKPTNGAGSSKEESTPSTSGTSISARNNVGHSNGNPGTSKSANEPRNEASSPSTPLSRSERLARRKTTSVTDN